MKLDIKKRSKPFRHRHSRNLINLLLFCARLFPYPSGGIFWSYLGICFYYLLPNERHLILSHIRQAMGAELSDAQIKSLGRACCSHFGLVFFELAHINRILKNFDDYIIVEGRQHLDKVMQQGRGLIAITGHIGNWELMAQAMAHLGYPVNVIARSIKPAQLNDTLVAFRRQNGVRSILRGDPKASRKILACLKQNEILGMLIDQDTKVQGVWTDFFGIPAYTPSGAAVLAHKMNCPVITCFIRRLSAGRHLIKLSEPLSLQHSENKDQDIIANTQYFNNLIESAIASAPEQWVWMHRRWKTKP